MTQIVIIGSDSGIVIGVDTRVTVRDPVTKEVTHFVNNDTKLFFSSRFKFAIAISGNTFVFHKDHPDDTSKAFSVAHIIRGFINFIEREKTFDVSNLIPTLLGKGGFIDKYYREYQKQIIDGVGIYCVGFKPDSKPYIGSFDFLSHGDKSIFDSNFDRGTAFQGLNKEFIGKELGNHFIEIATDKVAAQQIAPDARPYPAITYALRSGQSFKILRNILALAHEDLNLNKDLTIGDHYDLILLKSDGAVEFDFDKIPRHHYITQVALVENKDDTLNLWYLSKSDEADRQDDKADEKIDEESLKML